MLGAMPVPIPSLTDVITIVRVQATGARAMLPPPTARPPAAATNNTNPHESEQHVEVGQLRQHWKNLVVQKEVLLPARYSKRTLNCHGDVKHCRQALSIQSEDFAGRLHNTDHADRANIHTSGINCFERTTSPSVASSTIHA